MVRTLFSPRPLDAGVSKRVILYTRCTCSHASCSTCLKASSLSDLTCREGISRSHDCEKMFQVLQTLTFAWNNSTKAFSSGSSASQHSDVTVRFLESDNSRNRTRRIQSTLDVGVWKFHSISRRVHASCHTLRDRWTRVEVSLQVSREL